MKLFTVLFDVGMFTYIYTYIYICNMEKGGNKLEGE